MKHSLAECIHHIDTNQVIAISKALEEWEPECEGVSTLSLGS